MLLERVRGFGKMFPRLPCGLLFGVFGAVTIVTDAEKVLEAVRLFRVVELAERNDVVNVEASIRWEEVVSLFMFLVRESAALAFVVVAFESTSTSSGPVLSAFVPHPLSFPWLLVAVVASVAVFVNSHRLQN